MIIPILLLLTGFAILIKSADWLVKGASALAKRHNVSNLIIGLTIVAFGTSAPELAVNLIASFNDHSDIIYGNVIGSNNFNLFLILGIVGVILPISVQSSTVWKEIPISFAAVLVLFVLSNNYLFQNDFVLSRFDGGILLVLFFLFLVYIYGQMKKDVSTPDIKVKSTRTTRNSNTLQDVSTPDITVKSTSNLKIWSLIIIGLAGLVFSGRLVVNNATEIATGFEISEKIIGLTIIAFGTSLPELATSLVAAIKKNSDIAVGNIIGSNIFNIFLILSMSSFIRPVEYNPAFNFDMYLLMGGTVFLFIAMFTGKRKQLDRWEAAILIIVFLVYTLYSIKKEIILISLL